MKHADRISIIAAACVLASVPALQAADHGAASAKPTYASVEDIQYREGPDLSAPMRERCRLDVYTPQDTPDFATVVWFHGGGLRNGNRFIPAELKDQGIAVVAVGYRLTPDVKARVCIEDAAAAVAWVFRHIEDYGGSVDRIFVSGHSAGGYLTSMIGLDRRYLAVHGLDADRIAGLIPFSGHTITHMAVRDERGIGNLQPVVDEMAPLFHVRNDAPPILLITGGRDLELFGRYEETAYFWRMMQLVGHPSTVLNELQGFDHGGMAAPAHGLLLRFVRESIKAAEASKAGGPDA